MSTNTNSSDTSTASQSSQRTLFDPTEHVVPHNEKVEKRSTWEAYSFRVLDDGNVEVVNGSHDNPAEHTYHVVTDSRGIPKWCLQKPSGGEDWDDCPAMAYHCENIGETEDLVEAGEYEVCKHCYAMASNQAIIQAVREVKGAGD